MSKVLAIIRASSERQETESQKKEITQYLTKKIEKKYKKEDVLYIEVAGASARKLNQKYIDMINKVKSTLLSNPDINAVGLWHLNRLGRVKGVLEDMLDFFKKNHIQVYIMNPSYQLFDENGNVNMGVDIAWSVFAVMVEYDTKEFFSKSKRGKRRNATNKKYNGGKYIKYGYTIDENGFIIPNTNHPEGERSEVDIINLIFNEYATAKYSVKSLQDELRERGIRLRNNPITQHLINKIIKDAAYIGQKELSVKDDESGAEEVYYRNYDPIIEKEVWDKVSDIREGRIQTTKDKTRPETQHFALKILKCSSCGYNYIHSHDYYTCFQRAAGYKNINTPNRCKGSVGIIAHYMDDLLWKEARLFHLLYLKLYNSQAVEDLQTKLKVQEEKRLAAIKKVAEVEERLKRAAELYADMVYSKAEFEDKKARILNEKASWKSQIEISEEKIEEINRQINYSDTDEWFKTALNETDSQSKAAKNEIIHRYIKSATLTQESLLLLGSEEEEMATIIHIKNVRGDEKKYAYLPRRSNEFLRTYRYDDVRQKWVLVPITNYAEAISSVKYPNIKYERYREYITKFYAKGCGEDDLVSSLEETDESKILENYDTLKKAGKI